VTAYAQGSANGPGSIAGANPIGPTPPPPPAVEQALEILVALEILAELGARLFPLLPRVVEIAAGGLHAGSAAIASMISRASSASFTVDLDRLIDRGDAARSHPRAASRIRTFSPLGKGKPNRSEVRHVP
jgi:hypothetical protein